MVCSKLWFCPWLVEVLTQRSYKGNDECLPFATRYLQSHFKRHFKFVRKSFPAVKKERPFVRSFARRCKKSLMRKLEKGREKEERTERKLLQNSGPRLMTFWVLSLSSPFSGPEKKVPPFDSPGECLHQFQSHTLNRIVLLSAHLLACHRQFESSHGGGVWTRLGEMIT